MYGKIFESLWDGSMRGKSDLILVFINCITHANEDGIVDRHWQAISDETGIPLDRVKAAILELEAPDTESRTPTEDGRRMIRLDEHRGWGWQLVNHAHYRRMRKAEDRRDYMRDLMRKKRAVSNPLAHVSMLADTETETNADTEIHKGHNDAKKNDTWKTSYEIYLDECTLAYEALSANTDWIKQQEKFHPNIDIQLSLEKAFTNFWGTEAGWKHKKKARSKEINWKTTFTNAIDMNKVYRLRYGNNDAEKGRFTSV